MLQEIMKAIRTTLVVSNKESLPRCTHRIAKIIGDRESSCLQNERMRAWFNDITGLGDVALRDHMDAIEKLIESKKI